jgi:hypothetical protein
MSFSNWSRTAPLPPPGRVWSAIDKEVQVCNEIRGAPDACAQDVLKNTYKYLSPGLKGADIKPMSCIARGYKRQMYDPELLQGTYAWQVMNINSPCNIDKPIYLFTYQP